MKYRKIKLALISVSDDNASKEIKNALNEQSEIEYKEMNTIYEANHSVHIWKPDIVIIEEQNNIVAQKKLIEKIVEFNPSSYIIFLTKKEKAYEIISLLNIGVRGFVDLLGEKHRLSEVIRNNIIKAKAAIYSVENKKWEHAFLKTVMDNIDKIIFTTSKENITFFNENFRKFTLEYSKEKHIKQSNMFFSLFYLIDEQNSQLTLSEGKVKTNQLYKIKTKEKPFKIFHLKKVVVEGMEGLFLYTLHDITLDEEHTEKLRLLSSTDYLTGLLNRRETLKIFAKLISNEKTLSVTMMDIDHFKKINDRYGHDVGDEVLKKVSAIIKEVVGDFGTVARWGGEEFLVIFKCGIKTAYSLLKNIQKEISKEEFSNGIKPTLSFGLYEPDYLTELIGEIIEKADSALYHAKHNGRNKVAFYNDNKINPNVLKDQNDIFLNSSE